MSGHYSTLVSTDELARHVPSGTAAAAADASAAWVLIDCRFDLADTSWGEKQYEAAHIPGAVYASLERDLSGPTDGRNGRHPLPGHDEMARMFGRFGVQPGVQVVAYDQHNGMYASRLWWMLRYMGHDAVAVLDGGFARWVAEGRPTRSGAESRHPAAFTGKPRPGMRVSANQVWARLDDPRQVLVDARAPARFEGREEPLDKVAGHIPGARNYFFQWNVHDDGTFLPADVLRQNFERLLAGTPPEHVTMYCGSGVTACQNLLAMEHAGFTGLKLFPGSWSEWSADSDRPVATGSDAIPPGLDERR